MRTSQPQWLGRASLNQRSARGVKERDPTYSFDMRLNLTSQSLTTFGLGLLCGLGLSLLSGASPSGEFGVFARALDLIETEYIDERSYEELIYDAIGGLTQGLDDHSVFLDPEAYSALSETTRGEYSGVGLDARLADDHAEVVGMVPDAPAAKAGVEVGDRIVEVDGYGVSLGGVDGLVQRLRGPIGSVVKVGLLRRSSDETWQRLDLELRRAKVQVPSVFVEEQGDDLVSLKITRFQRDTRDELRSVLESRAQPPGGIVLDLRDNPGGYLSEAVKVADLWVREGVLVTTLDRGSRADHDRAKRFGTDAQTPIAVLINSGSASAAEIVAGALRDHSRARIIGYPSYGKGSVQRFFELGDGSALKLTTARYYTPSGEHFSGAGIEPEILLGPRGASAPGLELSELLGPQAGADDPAMQVALAWLRRPDQVDAWFAARLASAEE